MENKSWKKQYPLNTFTGQTKLELEFFIVQRIKEEQDRIVGILQSFKNEEWSAEIDEVIGAVIKKIRE